MNDTLVGLGGGAGLFDLGFVFVLVFVFVCVFVFVFVLDVADTLPGSYPNRKYMVCMVLDIIQWI